MSQYLMYLNWWHRNASSAALLSNISNILSWHKPYHGASPGASHVSRHGARAVRAPSLALSWSKLTYTLTHMNATVKYIRPSFIHACIYIYSTFIYIYIDTLSHPLSFVLYYCTSIESTLVAYCISSTALHPLSLQVVSGHIHIVLHIFTLLYRTDT